MLTPITLSLDSIIRLSKEHFSQLCQENPEAKLELTAKGELVIMSPTGGTSGNRNIKLSTRLEIWAERNGTGIAFDSSTMFHLPNGAFRSPDAAWIPLTKWNALTLQQQDSFPPICPDFVIELRSSSDRLQSLQNKLQEYLDNGTRLGWLIEPITKQVEIYRLGQEKEVLSHPNQLSGEEILPGFILDLTGIL